MGTPRAVLLPDGVEDNGQGLTEFIFKEVCALS
jgi:hypothetical protein